MRERDLEQLKNKLPREPFRTSMLYNSPRPPFDGLPKELGWSSYRVLEVWAELVHRRQVRILSTDGTDHFIAEVRR